MTNHTNLEQITTKHNGRITATNDAGTEFRIEFPIFMKAANFVNDATALVGHSDKVDWNALHNGRVVIVRL